jgi:hypothetical protein
LALPVRPITVAAVLHGQLTVIDARSARGAAFRNRSQRLSKPVDDARRLRCRHLGLERAERRDIVDRLRVTLKRVPPMSPTSICSPSGRHRKAGVDDVAHDGSSIRSELI